MPPDRRPAALAELSPNQRAKRDAIVETARAVLAERGIAAATARELAAAGPFTKSAVHYYFADMDELVDLAMARHIAGFEAILRAAGTTAADPAAAFWATVEAHLATFRDQPAAARLWFDYWIHASARQATGAVAAMHGTVVGVYADRLLAAGVDQPGQVARTVLTHLLGAVVDQAVDGPQDEAVRAALARLTRL